MSDPAMNDPAGPGIHVSVPYEALGLYLGPIREMRLDLELTFTGGNLDALTPGAMRATLLKLDHGPRLTVHAPYMDLSPGGVDERIRQVTYDRMRQTLDVAGELGASIVVVHSGYERWKFSHQPEVWLDGSSRMWESLLPLAEARGIRLAVENIFEDGPGTLAALMRRMGTPNMGICFDTGHFNLFAAGGGGLGEWLDELGPYIIETHLHDNAGQRDDHCAVESGIFDWAGFWGRMRGRRDVVHTIENKSVDAVLRSMERIMRALGRPA